MNFNFKRAILRFPDTPGVYLMRGKENKILYLGKAGNLKRRVSSYFTRPLEYRLQKMIMEIKKIDFKKTETAIEALILESQLIKKIQPPYNIREKDDKSFLYVEITNEKFPRLLLARGRDAKAPRLKILGQYGPFTSAKSIREALRLIRKIFPYSTHSPEKTNSASESLSRSNEVVSRRCFDWQIGLCPGTCIGGIERKEYAKTIRNIRLFFEGKKKKIIQRLQKEMEEAAAKEEYELADKKKRQVFALRHINDIALISDAESQFSVVSGQMPYERIEGYDISNISGTAAVGSMVVFVDGKPDKSAYRKFKIKTVIGSNDVGMLKEVLSRRFAREDWPLPGLVLIDGGQGQVSAAKEMLSEYGLDIPVVGIAKGPRRKRTDFIGALPPKPNKKTLVQVRDEAHRFAIGYHRKLREEEFLR